ncbi:MAG: family N-acetyltransferase [Actinotalea sp.]|nr:family N-acetyltransferase [Actinotalea sp.]
MSSHEVRIDVVPDEAAGDLLTVRRAAFVTEAQLYNDPHIPPLTQTLEELRRDLADTDVVTLGAWIGHRLVGSIRVGLEGSKATLGRLAVVPDLQGQGIGTQLLLAVPPHLRPTTSEVWVFTGQDSLQNLAMYTKHGYEHQFDQATGDLTYAYLRKILGEDPGDEAEDLDDLVEDDDAEQAEQTVV